MLHILHTIVAASAAHHLDEIQVVPGWESLVRRILDAHDTESETTWERELRSLQAAAEAYPHARPLLLTLDPTPPGRPLPTRLEWMPASRWLLGEG